MPAAEVSVYIKSSNNPSNYHLIPHTITIDEVENATLEVFSDAECTTPATSAVYGQTLYARMTPSSPEYAVFVMRYEYHGEILSSGISTGGDSPIYTNLHDENGTQTYSFTMPGQNVRVYGSTTASTFTLNYSVESNTLHGSLGVSTSSGNVRSGAKVPCGTVVTIAASSEEEYGIEYSVVTASGNAVPVTDNTFVMPTEDVTITANIAPIVEEAGYGITINDTAITNLNHRNVFEDGVVSYDPSSHVLRIASRTSPVISSIVSTIPERLTVIYNSFQDSGMSIEAAGDLQFINQTNYGDVNYLFFRGNFTINSGGSVSVNTVKSIIRGGISINAAKNIDVSMRSDWGSELALGGSMILNCNGDVNVSSNHLLVYNSPSADALVIGSASQPVRNVTISAAMSNGFSGGKGVLSSNYSFADAKIYSYGNVNITLNGTKAGSPTDKLFRNLYVNGAANVTIDLVNTPNSDGTNPAMNNLTLENCRGVLVTSPSNAVGGTLTYTLPEGSQLMGYVGEETEGTAIASGTSLSGMTYNRIYAEAAAGSEYEITAGDEGVYHTNTEEGPLSFTFSAENAVFRGVEVDGSVLAPSEYTYDEDTNTITLSEAIMKGLTEGEHQIGVIFSDGQATASFTVSAPVEYEMIEGDGGEFILDESGDFTFVSNAEFDLFCRVEIDGVVVDPATYTAVAGSTKITVSAEYMNELDEGSHTVAIVSMDGKAEGTFTVSKAAEETPTDPAEETDPSNENGNTGGNSNGTSGNTNGTTGNTNGTSGNTANNGSSTGTANAAGTTGSAAASAQNPQTGDRNNIAGYVFIIAICIIAIGAMARKSRKNR